jgi:hypothetical protein
VTVAKTDGAAPPPRNGADDNLDSRI